MLENPIAFPHLALIDWLNKGLQRTLQSGEKISLYVKIYSVQNGASIEIHYVA
jgi:hypothetical protein